MPQFSTTITIDGLPVFHSDHAVGTIAAGLANSIFCPLGPAPTRAWFLMRKSDLDQLESTPGAAHIISWDEHQASAHAGAGIEQNDFQGFYLVKSERINHGGLADPSGIHLVEFCDARGIAAAHSDTASLNANIRSYAQDTDYLDGTEDYTWITLTTAVWNACGVLGAFPGLPYAPDGVPVNTRFIGVSAWHALCAILDKLDCAIAHHPLAGIYEIVRLGASQNINEPTVRLKWDGEPNDGIACDVPATVRVYNHNHYDSYGQERDTELTTNWSTVGAGAYTDVVTGIAGAKAGSVKGLWDDLPRLLDENNTITNAAAITTRAQARSDNWVQRMRTTARHKVFWGVCNIGCGGQVRAVLWRNWGDYDGATGQANQLGGGTCTEYVSRPELITGMESSGDHAARVNFIIDKANENYQAVDLARHTYPVFPRLPNIVQVNDSGASAGEMIAANADGLHPGVVRRWVANAMVTLEDCWIRFVDKASGAVPAINGAMYGPGRLSGVSTSGGTLKPVYTVRRGAIVQWVEFTLTANMSAGVSANATVNDFWDDDPGAAVDVYDDQGLFTRALSGAKGIAVLDTVENKYVVVECQSKAGWIRGALTANMASSSAAASVTAYGGSQQDVQNPDPGAAGITVYDPQDLFTRALSGAKFKAAYDAIDDRYFLVECQSKAGWLEFTLNADMAAGSSAAATVDDFGGTQQDVQSPGSTVTIYDPHQIFPRALDGAKGYAIYDAVEDKYNAVTLQQRTMDLRGTLAGAITSATTTVDITTPVAMDHSPFNQAPVGTVTAYNVFHFDADSGAEAFVKWNEATTHWELIQVECPA